MYEGKGSNNDWSVKNNSDPFLKLVDEAKKVYEGSSTKQVDDAAGVNLPEDISEDIIRNVIYRLGGDLPEEFMTPPSEIGTQTGTRTTNVETQASLVDVEKLQNELRTKEKVISDMKKNIRQKEQEINELNGRRSNPDVLNAKEQEINNLNAKLREAEDQYDDLLGKVLVTDSNLKAEKENVRILTEKNEDLNRKLEKAKEISAAELEQVRREAAERFHQMKNIDEERAREEYTYTLSQAKAEMSEELTQAKNEKDKVYEELMKANERIEVLNAAKKKQHTHAQTQTIGDLDLNEREVGGVFAGTMENIDRINDLIENPEPSNIDYGKELYGDLEGLQIQINHWKEKAALSSGPEKQGYESFIKIAQREMDKIKLKLDRKVDDPETLRIIKEETENDPRTKFERFKKWTKENGLELGSVTISIGSLIAVLATALRKTIQTVAKGAFSFGKAVVKVLSKLGPVFTALGNVIMTLLGIASKALMWLGNNLWILLVFLVMFLWKMFEKYRSNKK